MAEPTDGVPASRVVVVDDSNFMDVTVGGVTVIDFWAPWCRPCRAFAPIFDEAALVYDGRVAFGKCNVDQNLRTAARLLVQSIPTVVAFGSDGSELRRAVGALSRCRLDAFLEALPPPRAVAETHGEATR